MQWCTVHGVAALTANHLHNFSSSFRYWAATETPPETHDMRSMQADLLGACWQVEPNLTAAQIPGLSLGESPDKVFSAVIFSETGLTPLLREPPASGAQGLPASERPVAILAAPWGSQMDPAWGRRRRAASAGRRSTGSGGSTVPFRPRSRNNRASWAVPSSPPLWAAPPRLEATAPCPCGPCPPRTPSLGHKQPLLPRGAEGQAAYLSPREAAAQHPAACRPVGSARRLSRRLRLSLRSGSAPSRFSYSIVTATAPGRRGPEHAHFRPEGAVLERWPEEVEEGGKWCTRPASAGGTSCCDGGLFDSAVQETPQSERVEAAVGERPAARWGKTYGRPPSDASASSAACAGLAAASGEWGGLWGSGVCPPVELVPWAAGAVGGAVGLRGRRKCGGQRRLYSDESWWTGAPLLGLGLTVGAKGWGQRGLIYCKCWFVVCQAESDVWRRNLGLEEHLS